MTLISELGLWTAGDSMNSKLWHGIFISCFKRTPQVDVKQLTAKEILDAMNWPPENWYRLYGMPCVENRPALACNICGILFLYRDAWYFHIDAHEEDI